MPELLTCCPACEAASYRTKSPRGTYPRDHPADYQCNECNHHFDEPAERERLGPSHRNGLANTLDQLDPAEVP